MDKNEMKENNYRELANYLFYCLCHLEGSDSAIQLIVEGGYDPNQLEGLDFNKKDIN